MTDKAEPPAGRPTWSIVSELTPNYRQFHLPQFNAHKQKTDGADNHVV